MFEDPSGVIVAGVSSFDAEELEVEEPEEIEVQVEEVVEEELKELETAETTGPVLSKKAKAKKAKAAKAKAAAEDEEEEIVASTPTLAPNGTQAPFQNGKLCHVFTQIRTLWLILPIFHRSWKGSSRLVSSAPSRTASKSTLRAEIRPTYCNSGSSTLRRDWSYTLGCATRRRSRGRMGRNQ